MMKYIAFQNDAGDEFIVTFPPMFHHDRYAEVLDYVRMDKGRNDWERFGVMESYMPISAGFVDFSGNCHGRSETLGLDSRGEEDTMLLKSGGMKKGVVKPT